MSRNGYNVNVYGDLEAIELRRITGRLLTEQQRSRGLSLRQIEEASGVSKSAVARILNAESGYYMENFDAVARALGLVPWQVYKQAEDELKHSDFMIAANTDPADPELEMFGQAEEA